MKIFIYDNFKLVLITIPLLPFVVISQLKFLSEKAIGTMFIFYMTKKIPELVSELLSGNPVYRGYQDAISLLGNKSNGLLTRPNANGGGVTPKEMLQNLSSAEPATTATQKISDTANSVKNVSSALANGVTNTLSGLDKKIRK